MWLATKIGFFSVTISDVDGRAQFRARVSEDLDELRAHLEPGGIALSETLTIEYADYRHRAFVEREDLPQALAILAGTIDYPNFKSAIAKTPPQRAKLDAYHEVWSVMNTLQK